MSLTEKIALEFELMQKGLNGNANHGLSALRRNAFSSFQRLGIPGNRHEEWKYTNIKTQLPESLSLAASKSFSVDKSIYHAFNEISATRLVFINNNYSKELSHIIEEKGVVAGSLKEHLFNDEELFQKYYNKLVQKYEEHFSALNTVFVSDGAFVHIKKGVKAKVPVIIIHLYNSPENFTQSRNLIIAEDNSEAQIAVDFQNTGNIAFYNHVSEIFAGKNSIVNVVKFQTKTANVTAVHTMEAEVDRDSKFTCTTISLEGKFIRNGTNVRLVGQNVDAHLYGLYYAKGNSLIDNHILIDHLVPNCNSNQLYKGILDDEGTGVFNGKILVKKDAQKTNAYQSSKAILLSDEASVNSKPQLEIFADDVKCSHGASVGQVNEDEIFYLRTRGIEEKDAKALLTYAFANEIVKDLFIPELRNYLDNKLKERLNLEF